MHLSAHINGLLYKNKSTTMQNLIQGTRYEHNIKREYQARKRQHPDL